MDLTCSWRQAAEDPELAEKLAFLRQLPGLQRMIETHMAYVFLTERLAYKLKKPLRVGFSNCRTLSARRRACQAEVRLNRALADEVYLGTVPLTRDGGGLALGGRGRVVDWLVHMRRLPEERMLDALIVARAGPTEAELGAVAARLAGFYRGQAATPVPRGMYLAHLTREQAINARHLAEMADLLPEPGAADMAGAVTAQLGAAAAEVAARESAGTVVEGHGDLRPEHLCLTDPPVIFDRVETAQELRVVDVYDEAMYLAAECALLGDGRIGAVLVRALCAAGFPAPSAGLMRTFVLLRLVTRARLSLDHLRDPAPRTPALWPIRAQSYLAAASRLAKSGGPAKEDNHADLRPDS